MDAMDTVQSTLDRVLLPYGITSHRGRRVDVDRIIINGNEIPVNRDEYVVYRLVSSPSGAYGDGKALTERKFVDVNYYYRYEKCDNRVKEVEKRIKEIKRALLSNPMIRLANGESDLPDIDSPYRGINLEFRLIGVADDGK